MQTMQKKDPRMRFFQFWQIFVGKGLLCQHSFFSRRMGQVPLVLVPFIQANAGPVC